MSERVRLTMLCDRDSLAVANEWARATLQLYRQAVRNPEHFASQADWKARFDQSMRELATFIERGTFDTHGRHS
ncbi:MAG: hypothetical protein P0119_07425 [Nitrospira sp.]|nr:hypothetical protein [Nitrospira sp.]